jgi:hypothetical protein
MKKWNSLITHLECEKKKSILQARRNKFTSTHVLHDYCKGEGSLRIWITTITKCSCNSLIPMQWTSEFITSPLGPV